MLVCFCCYWLVVQVLIMKDQRFLQFYYSDFCPAFCTGNGKLSVSAFHIIVVNSTVLDCDSSRWQETKFFSELLNIVHARVSRDFPSIFSPKVQWNLAPKQTRIFMS